MISKSDDNALPHTLVSQQPISLLPSVKTFRPEIYQLTFPAILNQDSDTDEDDISEDEMFPSSPVSKTGTCDNQTNSSFSIQPKPAETYIIFDPKKSTNGQVRSSRQLMMTRFFPGSSAIVTHKPESCCTIM